MGSAISAYGSLQQGEAGKAAADYNSQVAEENAVTARQQAKEQARRESISSEKLLGQMRAGYGASGVTMSGSAMDVLQESAANAELDRLTTLYAGDVKATAYKNESRLEKFKGNQAQTAGQIGAAAALLDGAAKMGKKG
mgnify:CR=1 FL=1